MKPTRLQRQQQVPADHRVERANFSEAQLADPLTAVKLAENGDFSRLLVVIALRPRLVRASDPVGMTALHWVCSDPRAPPRVVLTLARAYVKAAATRNLGGLLPLHLAIKNRLALEVIQALLNVYPKAIKVRTLDGKTPLMLAKERPVASSAVLLMLKALEAHTRKTNVPSMTIIPTTQWTETTLERQQGEKTEGSLSDRWRTSNLMTQEDTIAVTISPYPPLPRWALASRCRLCAAKFGYFRQRHHCRSCGVSVCGRHSRHRVSLKHLGLDQPQRVCIRCFDDLQKQINGRAIERVVRTGGAYPYIDNTSNFTNTVLTQSQRRSKSLRSESSQRYKTLDWECHTDNNSEASAHGFIPVSAPYNWRAVVTKPAEALQRTTGSMFLSVEPAQLTVLERQRLLRENNGVVSDSEPTRKDSRLRLRTQSSELDRSLSVQRLSEVESTDALEHGMLHSLDCGMETAQMERNLESIAQKYRDSGYSCPPECEDEDEEAEIAATMAFLNAGRRLSSTADLLEDIGAPFDLAATHHELGESLLSKGDFAGAVTELQRSVDLDEKNSLAWLDLAKALDGAGDDREAAEEAVRRALELEPASIGALSLLGKLLHLRGDHDDAILVFRQALELQCPMQRHISEVAHYA
ncbi:Membrane trafficking and cell signaling protein HRS, contains VHS and FYVE domains [Plasmopara halstedii]|uniref:Membrane trafficking and cell signaling protein HRS, contains VHS and FYVE domains n=1 Tax=Plasmopara halstedii TaxID=4781 RepID=A0A0P1AS53_PLAHL|nr:Membrane trafficking and cell signaling protein HRS, contains VHS and FYVE domains [Plasmopara halstedii]CEG44607.1 Membrane trafficking and cell signaling protein HRS, contains VHS and FYVE domains [Plasmopara halstedii]|eukprot:XP_024580976.1 Membrane trafficking and cell signaling protein HRS, contains VHS and FYVE domains [Plasmopara halstedii]